MAKKKSRKNRGKLHLADNEKLLEKLHEMVRTGHQDASTASSLVTWYMVNKYWTPKQLAYAKVLTTKKKRAPVRKKFNLYAIRAGELVKLGYSCDVRKRLKAMQTGCPEQLKVLWKYYVGDFEVEAKNQEKKLHRCCRKYHVRGEWFSKECMVLVEQFSTRHKIDREESQKNADLEILANSPI